MENKNILIGGGVVLAILFLMSKKKGVAKTGDESTEEELSSPVGGGGGFGFPAPQPTPTTPPPASSSKPATFPTCPSGELWNPKTNKCEKIVLEKEVGGGGTSGRTAYQTAKTAASGLTSATTSGTTTTRPPAGSTAPPTSGGTTTRPVGGGGTTPTCPKGYMYNSVTRQCVKMIEGEVGSGGMLFTGKEPLTLDNILC